MSTPSALFRKRAVLSQEFTDLLSKAAVLLDMPDTLYEKAVLDYKDVSAWLCAEDSDLRDYEPDIYPQGSFRLGTIVRPLSDDEEYDIDLVCRLTIEKESVTQEELKKMVGERLKKRKDISTMLREGRRCWIIDFPDDQFHMDVLPVIPNEERPPTGILLTDRELVRWQKSNPIAYADWFYSRMKIASTERREEIAKSLSASVEEVPDWLVKTPLQRIVQLLKRHRDIYFRDDTEHKPISIIITTLAALAYGEQRHLQEALVDIIEGMPAFIEHRNGQWWVANPVDDDENFADKWNEEPELEKAFMRWIDQVKLDLTSLTEAKTIGEASSMVAKIFGTNLTTGSVMSFSGVETRVAIPQERVPALADVSHCISLQWPSAPQYKAKMRGSVHRTQNDDRKLWDLTRRSVPPNLGLRFRLETNAPRPFDVWWQVVNTGEGAASVNQLRGDFFQAMRGGTEHWERTLYPGTHWIEAFIVKDGVCVARTDRKYVRIPS